MIITDKAQIKIAELRESNNLRLSGSDELECYELIESDLKLPADATFTRSSVAYLSDGTQVDANMPRFEQGRFGQAVLVEEGTTNLWSKGNPETWEGYSIFAIPSDLYSAQIVEFQGRTCLKVHVNSVGDGTQDVWRGCWIPHQFTTVTGDTYTQQCEMYVEPGGRYQGTISKPQLLGEYTLSGVNIIYDLNQVGTWQKLIRTSTANADGEGNLSIYLFAANAGTVYDADYTVYLYHPQIEKKSYPTSFIDGTRADETLTIPTAGVLNENEFDITGWFIPAASSSEVPAWARIWVLKGVPLTGLYINGSVICFAWNNKQIINTNISLSANDQLFYSVSKSGSNVVIRLAKNGEALSSFTGTTDGTTLGATEISLGSSGMEGSFYNGKHDDLRISNRARTDEEIAAAYTSGQPLPVDEWTAYKLDFDDKVRITTQGQIICNELIEI